MGLFGTIGKIAGGVLKVAGSVAKVAGSVAPIPGLGFAGGIAAKLGGAIAKADTVKASVGAAFTPGVLTTISNVMPGGARIGGNGAMAPKPVTTIMTPIGPIPVRTPPGYGATVSSSSSGTKRKRRRSGRRAKARRSSSRRRRGGKRRYTRAQIRAGFAGKRAKARAR